MKVRGKLAGVALTIIVGFLIAFSVLLYAQIQYSNAKQIEMVSRQLLVDWKALNAASLGVLAGSQRQRVEDTITWLSDSRNAFEQSLDTIMNSPGKELLKVDTRERIKRLPDIWAAVQPGVNDMQKRLSELAENQKSSNAFSGGIFRYILNASIGIKALDKELLSQVSQLALEIRKVETSSGPLDEQLVKIALETSSQAREISRRNTYISGGIIIIVAILALTLVIIFSHRMANRIKKIEATMRLVAERDFTVHTRTDTNDELGLLGRYINSVLETTRDTLSTAKDASNKVGQLQINLASGTEQTSTAIQEISKNIESIRNQFSNLNRTTSETTGAVESITDLIVDLTADLDSDVKAVRDTASSIERMGSSIKGVAHLAQDHRHRAEELLEVIRSNGEKVKSANSLIETVSHKINAILEASQIIDSVAEQTNLLSMNAAIESAHAGEAGSGFAVVADEIRKLSESTTENSRRMGETLRTVANEIKEALEASQESATSFYSITEDVELFHGAMVEITDGTSELESRSGQVMESTNEMDELTQSVRGKYDRIQSTSNQIRETMEKLNIVSNEVMSGITEIDVGTNEILRAVVDVSKLGNETTERVRELEKLIDTFKTSTQESLEEGSEGKKRS